MQTKKQTPEAVDHAGRLSAVLAAMGIKRATFVDDQFSLKFEDAWARSKVIAATKGNELTAAWAGVDWTAESLDDERQSAETGWNKLDATARHTLMSSIQSWQQPPDAEPAKDVTYFANHWPDTCTLDECGPEHFDSAYIKSALLGAGPSLLFLDLNLGQGDEEGGVRLLQTVLNEDKDRKTVCVILTSQDGADTPDFWSKLAERTGLDPASAVVITKASTESIEVFERELRRALLNSMSPGLMKWAWDVAKQALTSAISSAKLEGDVLHAVVLQSSEKEGIHPTETLFRLLDEEFRQARERLALAKEGHEGFEVFKKRLEALAKIAPNEAKAEPALTSRARKLMRSHLYRAPNILPEWPSPMWLGDIWEVALQDETTEQFVAIGQPCDIILRTEGDRAQEWVLLAPLKKDKGKHADQVVELKYFDETKYDSRFVYLKWARISNVNVLDLVALVGPTVKRAEIALLKARAHVHNSVKNRTAILLNWLEALPADATSALPLALFSTGVAAKLTNTPDEVNFHCRRVGRVEPELSRLLLQRYGNFVSRPALPHDFSDFESPKPKEAKKTEAKEVGEKQVDGKTDRKRVELKLDVKPVELKQVADGNPVDLKKTVDADHAADVETVDEKASPGDNSTASVK